MKLLKIAFTIMAVASLSLSARAQSVDLYGQPRTLVVSTPALLSVNVLTTTNGPADTHGYDGIAKIDIFSVTNAGGTLTAQFYTSPDQTNLTALANYSLAVSSSVVYTNTMYGNATKLTATNTFLLPGTLTVPTPATAGWATPYLVPALFTNTGAVTITANGIYEIGYNVGDAARYLYVVWTAGATNSQNYVGAVLTGRKAQ